MEIIVSHGSTTLGTEVALIAWYPDSLSSVEAVVVVALSITTSAALSLLLLLAGVVFVLGVVSLFVLRHDLQESKGVSEGRMVEGCT